MKRKPRIEYTEQELRNSIKNNFSWRQVLRELGFVNDAGGNYNTLKKRARFFGIDFSHFKGKGWNLDGKSHNRIDDIFINGKIRSGGILKKRIIKNNLIEYKCEKCKNNDVWMEEKIVLELDHIDGDKKNNTIENLRFLCPNCHSQTHNFRGRNNKYGHRCSLCSKKIWYKNKTGLCENCKKNKSS